MELKMATDNSSDNTSTIDNLQGVDKDDKTQDLIITKKGKLKWRPNCTSIVRR